MGGFSSIFIDRPIFAMVIAIVIGLQTVGVVLMSAMVVAPAAAATPLVLGEKGSPLELALGTLYFAADTPPSLPYAECERVADSGLATAVPVHLRFRARRQPIVGTSLDYFALRGLAVAAVRERLGLLGRRAEPRGGTAPRCSSPRTHRRCPSSISAASRPRRSRSMICSAWVPPPGRGSMWPPGWIDPPALSVEP